MSIEKSALEEEERRMFTDQEPQPSLAAVIAEDVVARQSKRGVGSRQEEDKVESHAQLRTGELRVPVSGLQLLREPQEEVHGVQHGREPLPERRPSNEPRHLGRKDHHSLKSERMQKSGRVGEARREASANEPAGREEVALAMH